ncbi:MAG: 2-oxo acid dehydrogenase subunit E2 [Chloroflexi bacterium]|nr:2-oxo acid dehydrogenase subunit E2 [Chloroflexota bacterium]
MAVDVVVPALGLGKSSGVLAEWYRADGESVSAGEPIYRFESAFVAIEVEAEGEGVLRHCVGAGETPHWGEVAGVILGPGERFEARVREHAFTHIDEPHTPAPGPEPEAFDEHRESEPEAGDEPPAFDAPRDEEPIPGVAHVPQPVEPASLPLLFRRRGGPPPPPEPELSSFWSHESDDIEAFQDALLHREPPTAETPKATLSFGFGNDDIPEEPQWPHRTHDFAGEPEAPDADADNDDDLQAVFEPAPEPPAATSWQDFEAAPEASDSTDTFDFQFDPEDEPAAFEGAFVFEAPAEAPPAVHSELGTRDPELGTPLSTQHSGLSTLDLGTPLSTPDLGTRDSELGTTLPAFGARGDVVEPWDDQLAYPGPEETIVHDAPVVSTAPTSFASVPLVLRTTVALGEVRKLRAQLGREWRQSGAEPTDEDVVIRAVARALLGVGPLWLRGDDIGLLLAERDTERLCVVRGAAHRPFRDAVTELAAVRKTADDNADCACTVVNFGEHGIDEGVPPLPEGHAFALALGAVRDVPVFEGEQVRRGQVAVVTIAYSPEYLPVGEAAWLLGRVRELLEAPYALLAD